MPIIDYNNYYLSPLLNTFMANQRVKSMSEEEKKSSWYDDNLFNSKDVNFSKGEAVGLGRGLLDSFGMFMNDKKTANSERDMLQKRRANDYSLLPTDYYGYNTFSENAYNNSYFQEGGETEEDTFNTTEMYSPFEEKENDDELALSFLSSLFDDEEDNPRQRNYDYMDMDYDTATPSYNNYNQNTSSFTPNIDHSQSVAVRHNNPGNIKYGDFTKKFGAVQGDYSKTEKDGSYYAYFPTIEQGLQAQRELLRGKNYRNLTVPQALHRWAAGSYTDQNFINMFGNKRIVDLSDYELSLLQKEQIKQEDRNMYNKIFKN